MSDRLLKLWVAANVALVAGYLFYLWMIGLVVR